MSAAIDHRSLKDDFTVQPAFYPAATYVKPVAKLARVLLPEHGLATMRVATSARSGARWAWLGGDSGLRALDHRAQFRESEQSAQLGLLKVLTLGDQDLPSRSGRG